MIHQISLVAHADWSVDPKKRWFSFATLQEKGHFRAYAPEQVVHPDSFLNHLVGIAGSPSCILAGFDFPIGLPSRYAKLTGITDFLAWLPGLEQGEWSEFFQIAESYDQISLHRPFYPRRPGGASRRHLCERLGVDTFSDLLRECDWAHPGRRAACPLFWTLGGQQVGKAAIHGWKEILIPALLTQTKGGSRPLRKIAIWPFSGNLEMLLGENVSILVETYPAEFYSHLGIKFSPNRAGGRSGKRVQADRANNAAALCNKAAEIGVSIDPGLEKDIREGFGASADGEDRFDAVVGLLGMLDFLNRSEHFAEPEGEYTRSVEGWIFGMDQAA